jgi:excisionase family DNA binding protein
MVSIAVVTNNDEQTGTETMKLEGNYISVSQAAEALGVTTGRLRQLCIANRIPGARKVGTDWLVPKPTVVLSTGSEASVGRKLKMKKVG